MMAAEEITMPRRLHGLIVIELLLILILTGGSAEVWSQGTARGLGMGGAYTTLARGVQSVWWNPANLGFHTNARVTALLASGTTRLANNGLSISSYRKYYEAPLSESAIRALLSQTPHEGMQNDLQIGMKYASFSMGHFAVAAQLRAESQLFFQEHLLDLIFNNEIYHGARFKLDAPLSAQLLSFNTLTFSYGHAMRLAKTSELALGASLHIFNGIKYAQLTTEEMTWAANQKNFNLEGDYTLVSGSGSLSGGLDLGLNARVNNFFQLGLFLQNIMGNLPWDGDLISEYGHFKGDSLRYLNYDSRRQSYPTNWKGKTALRKAKTLLSGFDTRLPQAAVFGTSLSSGRFDLAASYTHHFGSNIFIQSEDLISAGLEWRLLRVLPLRAGVVLAGEEKSIALGAGFHPFGFDLDIGWMHTGNINPFQAHDILLAMDIGVSLR